MAGCIHNVLVREPNSRSQSRPYIIVIGRRITGPTFDNNDKYCTNNLHNSSLSRAKSHYYKRKRRSNKK